MTHAIVARLTQQLRDKGIENPEAVAVGRLKEYGILDADGNLTEKGRERNDMTPGQRAIDRAAKVGGHPKDHYVYDESTNRARLKGGV